MTEDVPDKVVNNIVQQFPDVEKIVLFGSQARGNAGPDSDWDFLVVMPSSMKPRQRGVAVRRVARLRGYAMDFVVVTPEEVARGFPLMADDILHGGKVLYERPG